VDGENHVELRLAGMKVSAGAHLLGKSAQERLRIRLVPSRSDESGTTRLRLAGSGGTDGAALRGVTLQEVRELGLLRPCPATGGNLDTTLEVQPG